MSFGTSIKLDALELDFYASWVHTPSLCIFCQSSSLELESVMAARRARFSLLLTCGSMWTLMRASHTALPDHISRIST